MNIASYGSSSALKLEMLKAILGQQEIWADGREIVFSGEKARLFPGLRYRSTEVVVRPGQCSGARAPTQVTGLLFVPTIHSAYFLGLVSTTERATSAPLPPTSLHKSPGPAPNKCMVFFT